jgi:uncharacterized protein (DUF2236 family)
VNDSGYFPRGSSLLRRVHEERAVGLFYGQRALCIGALHPLNYVGTSEHTAAKATPFKRLAHTANWFETIMFASRARADEVLTAVHKMHRRVNGTLPREAGLYPAGTRYDAFDPALMLWTVAVMMDSAERFHDLLVRRLRRAERERLWSEYVRFGELFGMPREAAPETYAGFREYFDGFLEGPHAHLTDEARYMGRAVAFEIPMAAHVRPAKRVHDLIMLGALPARVRELYGLSFTPAHAAAFVLAVRSAKAALAVMPRALTHGSNQPFFEAVAQTEAWRIARGRPTPGLAGQAAGNCG